MTKTLLISGVLMTASAFTAPVAGGPCATAKGYELYALGSLGCTVNDGKTRLSFSPFFSYEQIGQSRFDFADVTGPVFRIDVTPQPNVATMLFRVSISTEEMMTAVRDSAQGTATTPAMVGLSQYSSTVAIGPWAIAAPDWWSVPLARSGFIVGAYAVPTANVPPSVEISRYSLMFEVIPAPEPSTGLLVAAAAALFGIAAKVNLKG